MYHPAMRFRLACLFAVLSVSLAASACHSGGISANRADGAAGSGGGVAAGGTGGVAAGGVAAGGVAAGGTGAAGGSATGVRDGAVAMTPLDVCRAAIMAQAQRRAVCTGNSVQRYLDVANACPDYYFGADSNRTVAGVAACLSTLSALTCTDVALSLLPACLAGGQDPEGAICAYPSQCQSNFCLSDGTECSACRAAIPVGGTCTSNLSGCEGGSFCNLGTGRCTDAKTIVYAKEGEPCDLRGTPVVGCEGDLQCLGPSSTSQGTCTAPVAAGQSCNGTNTHCAVNTTCSAAAGGICLAAGDCGAGLPCDANSYCRAGDGGLTCLPRATVGPAVRRLGLGRPRPLPGACSLFGRDMRDAKPIRSIGRYLRPEPPLWPIPRVRGGNLSAAGHHVSDRIRRQRNRVSRTPTPIPSGFPRAGRREGCRRETGRCRNAARWPLLRGYRRR